MMRFSKIHLKLKHGLQFFAALCAIGAHSALADVEITPLRHVLTSEAPKATVTVSNPSRRILHGKVRWTHLSAGEKGYQPASAEALSTLSAAPWLIISPAQFRLDPGGRTEITVVVREGAKIPAGERRSHLLIETAAGRSLMRKASDNGLQVDIGAGVSIPIILRGASGSAAAKFADTKLLRDKNGLLLLATNVIPKGMHSTYGRILVFFEPADKPGVARELAALANVAGYTDVQKRYYEIPLGYFSLGAGKLTLIYEGTGEYNGVTFDEREFDIKDAD